jgi:hypothetical protein
MTNRTAWTPPPSWPQPPVGWFPPQGWTPPRQWPAPPAHWQWWQPARRSATGFHLAGVGLLALSLVGYPILLFTVYLATVGCEGPSHPRALRAGLVVIGGLLIGMPALWARVARRQGHAWLPWLVVAALLVPVAVAAGHAMLPDPRSTTAGCLVVF